MPTKKMLEQGQELQVPSALFNHLFVVNLSPFTLEVEMVHNDLANPIIILRGGGVGGKLTEEDKEINDKLKEYEGKEI